MQKEYDVAVIGGGIVGSNIGYGLAKRNVKVAVIDEAPSLSRASRSNVGLIWYQANGKGNPACSRWFLSAVTNYQAYVDEIQKNSGINVGFVHTGGIEPTLGESGFLAKEKRNLDMKAQNFDNHFPVEMINRSELQKLAPKVAFGSEVSGASFCEHEGWLNPLLLMFAVRKSFVNLGGTLLDGCNVSSIQHKNKEYILETSKGVIRANKIVLAAGLGVRRLANQLGFYPYVSPNGGHKLLFEKVPDIMPITLQIMTRTHGGNMLFAAEHHHSWSSTETNSKMILRQLELAVRYWPALAKLRLIRTWFGLRVMPDDGVPIYDKVPNHENAFMFAMHNAVTLSVHSQSHLANYVMGEELPEDANNFRLSRFNIQ